jgi:hypothetical protein
VAGQSIVEDTVSGLVWQGCAVGLSGSSCSTGSATTHTWSQALAYCDSLNWGGQTDWRLPDPYELASIVDSGRHSPAIDPAAFPGTPSSWFWSSSSVPFSSSVAWLVIFDNGYVLSGDKMFVSRVRCVRLGPFESRRFEPLNLSSDRVVKDSLTGLEWQGCAAGLTGDLCETGSATEMTWQQALSYCEGLSHGGHTDWTLPNRTELQSILDLRLHFPPRIDAVAFPGTPSSWFWSSSSDVSSSLPAAAWDVEFGAGFVSFSDKNYAKPARCVRGRVGP